jgi:hypothetical protein
MHGGGASCEIVETIERHRRRCGFRQWFFRKPAHECIHPNILSPRVRIQIDMHHVGSLHAPLDRAVEFKFLRGITSVCFCLRQGLEVSEFRSILDRLRANKQKRTHNTGLRVVALTKTTYDNHTGCICRSVTVKAWREYINVKLSRCCARWFRAVRVRHI